MDFEIELKLGQDVDAKSMIDLVQQLETESKNVEFDAHLKELTLAEIEENLLLIDASPTNCLLVAMANDRPIGIITLVETDLKKHQAELGVGVLKEFWNYKIGTLLVDEALYWANNFSNLSQIWLDVYVDNVAAVALYKKFDFQNKKPPFSDENGALIQRMEYVVTQLGE